MSERYLLIKLCNGEELIGEVVSSEGSNEMLIHKPMSISQGSISRYHYYRDEDDPYVVLFKHGIISTATPGAQYINFYLKCLDLEKGMTTVPVLADTVFEGTGTIN